MLLDLVGLVLLILAFSRATYYPLSKLELENRPHVYNCRSSEYSTTSLHPEVQLVPLTSAPI